MKTLVAILGLLGFLVTATAQPSAPEAGGTVRSISGQFIIRPSPAPTDPRLADRLLSSGRFYQTDPALLAVSCERIKQILWRKLEAKPSFRGRIFLDLRPAESLNDTVRLSAEKFSDGWRYRISLPEIIDREQFVRVIVQSLLLEVANRDAAERCVELPLWLVEGLSHETAALSEAGGEFKIFLELNERQAGSASAKRFTLSESRERRTNTLHWAHIVLSSQSALTFEQLSWPEANQLQAENSDVYQSSAQLFVVRLLEFKDGPACLRSMIGQSDKFLNWQIPFLKAFKAHFAAPLDVEKWWAVQVSHFTGRELLQNWSATDSWRKLDDALRAPVNVSTGGGAEPLRTDVTLQMLLRDSNGLQQESFFRHKLDSLNALRPRLSPELVGVLDDYRAAIGGFLEKNKVSNPFLRIRKFHELRLNRAADELIRQLDALDAKRVALKPAAVEPPSEKEQEEMKAAFR